MSCDFTALAIPGVQELKPYLPGKPAEELQRELGLASVVKLASNENPLGVSEKVKAALQSELDMLALYPDSAGYHLKQALSRELGVSVDQLTLGNGSNDVLDLIARAFLAPGSEVIYSEYAFLVYAISSQAAGATAIVTPAKAWGHDLEAMAQAVSERTRVIFLANPNNPTGTWFTAQALDQFLAQVPETVLVVLDEAYTEYVEQPDFPDGLALQKRYPNLIVTRTFSKAYGLAGLRIGYAVSDPQVADVLSRVRQPFNVNSLGLLAARVALSDAEFLQQTLVCNQQGMRQLETGLKALGLEWIASAGNFLTVDMQQPALPIYQALLQKGVIVRPLANYAMPNHLRISIGLPHENARCLEVLQEVLGL
ncbi:histidinol-phosphate transaminase [Neptuniibacter sp. CAU 1671]|uniref:histidinol-phosphate transaminase n=1 Tax=Neptuniibacter sp. CAU 1671 TaxID=3032593 RepID=UPI0023D98AA5|nr:histidinol-phosphate transaminase [Neptuniibacter sp. CAU 1671]MDF2181499.1 histidinol-phosphate transaminase [Neptuniibacter sp. CAU 1671]